MGAPERLREIWQALESGQPMEHTSVVVPSLSFDPEELAKISGVPFYEERLLFSIMRLRNPWARVLFLTSQPIHPDIVDYYLDLLVDVPAKHARARLRLQSVYDSSSRPLTAKILERPRVIERIRSWIGDPRYAYLTCFNSTELERQLAVRLGVPLNGVDPDLLWLGSKSGSRKTFREAGVSLPFGFEDLESREEVVEALASIAADRRPRRAVVKLNDSFAGAGNAVVEMPGTEDRLPGPAAIGRALGGVCWSDLETTEEAFFRKLGEMGGIAEEMLDAEVVRSPSVQMRIDPGGGVALVSSHDQVLGGPTGQSYVGCRFPAHADYRELIQAEALKIGEVLRRHGVISRFAVDFLVIREKGGAWSADAIEINLRMGGTTPPFLALQFLTGGTLDQESGELRSPRGPAKYYFATDTLSSPAYRGLLPEDFMDILTYHGLRFAPSTETGVVFHMIGALSEYGKVGVTCIGDSREQAEELYRRTADILDAETSSEAGTAVGAAAGRRVRTPME